MNKIIILTVLLFTTYSSIDKKNIEKTIETTGISIEDSEYTLHIDVDNTIDGQPFLVVKMELKNEAHFVSPNEKRDFKGKFYMDLGSSKEISFNDEIIETPKAVARYDGFVNDQVIWIHNNTTYTQSLNLKVKEDFQVFGRVNFVIEPRCTLEQITFGIVSKNGVLKVIEAKC